MEVFGGGLWEVSRGAEGAFLKISEFTRRDLGEVLSFSTMWAHSKKVSLCISHSRINCHLLSWY